MRAPTLARTVIILAALGIAVAGCGRKGDLLTPTQAAQDAQRAPSSNPLSDDTPPPPPVPDRPFVLDALL
jgi:predicted small lipoprotein YifL